MKFNWINLWSGLTVAFMLVPNIILATKMPQEKNKYGHALINATEQLGRYACIILMTLPVAVGEFGFRSVLEMLIYFGSTSLLLIIYLIVWPFYFRAPTRKKATALAVLPTMVFLISGLLLRHWLLAAASIIFGASHIYISARNNS